MMHFLRPFPAGVLITSVVLASSVRPRLPPADNRNRRRMLSTHRFGHS